MRSKDAVGFFDSNVEDYEVKYYGEAVRSFMTVRQHRVLELVDQLNLPPGARVLDAGCGPGYLVEALANRGFQVIGMDAAMGMVRSTRERLRAGGGAGSTSFERGSIEQLPYRDGCFDLVCSNGVIEYLPRDAEALAEFYRVLRPGAHAILPVTNLWSPINWLDSVIEFLKRRDLLRKPFNAVWQRLGNRPVLPRHFRVRRHLPGRFRGALRETGFRVADALYFYFLPWPHPVDQFLPRASARIGARMERLARTRLGPLAEGYLTLVTKTERD